MHDHRLEAATKQEWAERAFKAEEKMEAIKSMLHQLTERNVQYIGDNIVLRDFGSHDNAVSAIRWARALCK